MTGTKPTSGYDIMKAAGLTPDEGVVIALFPDKVEEVELGESWRWDPEHDAHSIIGNLGPWGKRLLDIVTEPATDVRWWKVTSYAKTRGLDAVPVRWSGPICEIPEQYFKDGAILGVRLYGAGPWFWPLETPAIKSQEESLMEKNLKVLEGFGSGGLNG